MAYIRKDFKERYETVYGGKRLLLAISGGMDSMCLLELSAQLCQQIHVLYIDHMTRNGVSTSDGMMVKQYCANKAIDFNREVYDHQGGNFQEQARNFRYNKLEEYRQRLSADFILTGHHQDDHIESFLMQIMRGTSLRNKPGISDRGHYHRPLIYYSRKDLHNYAQAHYIPYVEDISNQDSHYLRNFIRNEFLNPLYEKAPHARKGILSSINNFSEDAHLLTSLIEKAVEIKGHQINLSLLHAYPYRSRMLFHRLSDIGITMDQCDNIFTAETGAVFITPSHHLHIDRASLHILQSDLEPPSTLTIHTPGRYSYGQEFILIEKGEEENRNDTSIPINANKINFPLIIRPWKPGDTFKPVKLKGKSQKIKKYFVEKKVPLFLKASIPILTTPDDEIIAILGYEASYDYLGSEDGSDLIVCYPF